MLIMTRENFRYLSFWSLVAAGFRSTQDLDFNLVTAHCMHGVIRVDINVWLLRIISYKAKALCIATKDPADRFRLDNRLKFTLIGYHDFFIPFQLCQCLNDRRKLICSVHSQLLGDFSAEKLSS